MSILDGLFILGAFVLGVGIGAAVTEKENRQPEVKIYDAIGIEHFEKLVEHYESLVRIILGGGK